MYFYLCIRFNKKKYQPNTFISYLLQSYLGHDSEKASEKWTNLTVPL